METDLDNSTNLDIEHTCAERLPHWDWHWLHCCATTASTVRWGVFEDRDDKEPNSFELACPWLWSRWFFDCVDILTTHPELPPSVNAHSVGYHVPWWSLQNLWHLRFLSGRGLASALNRSTNYNLWVSRNLEGIGLNPKIQPFSAHHSSHSSSYLGS